MNTPTSRAPHIWCQVLRATSASCVADNRSNSAIKIHDTRMAVPATAGAQLKAALTVLPGSIEELAATASLKGTYLGSTDQGPVHSTTTTTSTMKGSQAPKAPLRVRAAARRPRGGRPAAGCARA